MTHLSPFDGLLGLATLHPVFTMGPVLLIIAAAILARRRLVASRSPRRRP